MGTCTCGRTSKYKDGRCRRCYVRDWEQAKKVTGGPTKSPEVQQWFDWTAVERALAGQQVGRKLTRAERVWLIDHTGLRGKPLGRLLGMEPPEADKLAAQITAGVVPVIPRDWQGKALLPLTPQ